MKKHTMNFMPLRRHAGKLMLAALISAAALTTQAQTGSSAEAIARNATIKYLGGENDLQSFVVSYPNEEGNRFNLTISDRAGNRLYQATYTDRNFSKVFTVPAFEDGKLIFSFRDSKTNSVQTYEVNATIKTYSEVKVKKIS